MPRIFTYPNTDYVTYGLVDPEVFKAQEREIRKLPGVLRTGFIRDGQVPFVDLDAVQLETEHGWLRVPPLRFTLGLWLVDFPLPGVSLEDRTSDFHDWVIVHLITRRGAWRKLKEDYMAHPGIGLSSDFDQIESAFGSVCWGEYGSYVEPLIQEDRYVELTQVLQVYLSEYNPSEWGRRDLKTWFRSRLKQPQGALP